MGSSFPSTATSSSRALPILVRLPRPPTACSTTILRSKPAARSIAGPSSLRSCALLMPTEEPRFAGLTKSGYLSAASSLAMTFLGSCFHSLAEEGYVLGDGQPGGEEEALHDFFVHARLPSRAPRSRRRLTRRARTGPAWCHLRQTYRAARERRHPTAAHRALGRWRMPRARKVRGCRLGHLPRPAWAAR